MSPLVTCHIYLCRTNAPTGFACAERGSRPVCGLLYGAPSVFKNEYCAYCNNVTDFLSGVCPALYPSNATKVTQCDAEILAGMSAAIANATRDRCASADEPRCWNGTTYANV
jgi:hypothetical protein